jgi:hypothetical protein
MKDDPGTDEYGDRAAANETQISLMTLLTTEPQPPPIPDGMPESTAKQWMMIYNQNQQRFARRMGLLKDVGMVLLGYASAQTIMSALPKRTAAPLPAVDPAVAEAMRRQRGAM